MNLRDRIRSLTGETAPEPKASPRKDEIAALRKRVEEIMNRRPVRRTVAPGRPGITRSAIGDGEEIANEFGRCVVLSRRTEGSSLHGRRAVREFAAMDMKAASLLANRPEFASLSWQEGLFLDTETTGLAGGTGTVAFLVGLGWFEGEAFESRQIFLRDFGDEPAALAALKEYARDRRFLVSFNGKAFDINLLSSRFIMNRLGDPLAGLPHLDLLHPARRLLGHRLENSRLTTMEEQVLGLMRDHDVPGSEIPQRYFDWLRYGDPLLLRDVFLHNRLDVISLAALASHLSGILHAGADRGCFEATDRLAAAKLLHLRGETDSAVNALGDLVRSECLPVRGEARRHLALIFKKKGRWEDSAALWEEMITEDPNNRFALEELAKVCEHRRRDPQRAAELAKQALQAVPAPSPREAEALQHRLTRLQRLMHQD
jgi:hypothetical protein